MSSLLTRLHFRRYFQVVHFSRIAFYALTTYVGTLSFSTKWMNFLGSFYASVKDIHERIYLFEGNSIDEFNFPLKIGNRIKIMIDNPIDF